MENALSRSHIATRPGLISKLRAMVSLRRQRRDLHALSDHLLDDIGVTAADARREAERPVWDVPTHWKR
ncbi:DUF1127 domain-containing protein [Defluviimonas sp. WL0050]|uniref:DUF1127 domain-containing protein n=1 Tax=Albidovulum litorale TaxID=2984134 RepID=A0ABT2ZU05_9RHOB|nr:DUF1127 domain-containing protein [Defluviimonas sp. WL0050]MCV2874492.1 DUF1127 domain-containing protein [Defluviimonas sp. WL0050]